MRGHTADVGGSCSWKSFGVDRLLVRSLQSTCNQLRRPCMQTDCPYQAHAQTCKRNWHKDTNMIKHAYDQAISSICSLTARLTCLHRIPERRSYSLVGSCTQAEALIRHDCIL